MVRMTPKYSGEESKGFWELVKSIKNRRDHDAAYMLGVILQNLEGDVLNELDRLTREKAKK